MSTNNEELIEAIANLHLELLATRGALWEVVMRLKSELGHYSIDNMHPSDYIYLLKRKHGEVELIRFKKGLNEIHPAIKDYMKDHKIEDYIDYGKCT